MVQDTNTFAKRFLSLIDIYCENIYECLGFREGNVIMFNEQRPETDRPQPTTRMKVDEICVAHLDNKEIKFRIVGRIITYLGKITDKKSYLRITFSDEYPTGSVSYRIESIDNIENIVRAKKNLRQFKDLAPLPQVDPVKAMAVNTETVSVPVPKPKVDNTPVATEINFPVPRMKRAPKDIQQKVHKSDYEAMAAAGINVDKIRQETETYIVHSAQPPIKDMGTVISVIKDSGKPNKSINIKKKSTKKKINKPVVNNMSNSQRQTMDESPKFSLF